MGTNSMSLCIPEEGALVNRSNYLLVKQHLTYLDEIRQISQSSLERYRFYLHHLLIWADETLLAKAGKIKPSFPKYVSSLKGRREEPNLAITSQKKIINTAKRFLRWVKLTHPNKFRSLSEAWIEALHPPRWENQNKEHTYVSLNEVIRLVSVPAELEDLATQRDKAATAMLFLSGMRATAFTTLPIKAVDLKTNSIKQWPELGVLTKNKKRSTTFLLPIPELLEVVKKWDERIRQDLPSSTPWYTPIISNWGDQTLSHKEPGKNRGQALSKRLKILYEAAELEYKSPHKFRHGHAVYGLQHADTMADYKAVSMNLMHKDIQITDQIYAPILSEEVGNRIANLNHGKDEDVIAGLDLDIGYLTKSQLSQLMIAAAKALSAG